MTVIIGRKLVYMASNFLYSKLQDLTSCPNVHIFAKRCKVMVVFLYALFFIVKETLISSKSITTISLNPRAENVYYTRDKTVFACTGCNASHR